MKVSLPSASNGYLTFQHSVNIFAILHGFPGLHSVEFISEKGVQIPVDECEILRSKRSEESTAIVCYLLNELGRCYSVA